MNSVPLVVTTRGLARDSGTIENVHHGAIAVVAADGKVLFHAGDPDYLTFTRSTLKPFQALPFVLDGGAARFGFGARELALMCASHSGEAMHVEVVSAMLARVACTEADLQCGCHVPGYYAALGKKPPEGAIFAPIQNNCSGKHAGFLAACRLCGEAPEHYLDLDHAVQRRVRQAVADAARLAPDALAVGIDGCSAPNYAMPLAGLAGLYARLSLGKDDAELGAALGPLFDAMTGHPELVSGTARSDLALMAATPGDWVTKIGADGVQAIGVRTAGLGIALKIGDGNRDALYCAAVETLVQLGLIEGEVPATLLRWQRPAQRNVRGTVTGEMRPVFKLHRA